jgi:hypothetical protein
VGDTDWAIAKPKKLRAEGSTVDDIVTKLKLTEMDTSVSDADAKKAAASYASAPLTGSIKVIDSTATQSLEVRKIKDDYYAKSSAIDGVYKIGKDLGDALGKSLDDYRNKKVFDFGFNDPNRVTIEDAGKATAYEKLNMKWMAGGKEIDSTSLQAFIDRLRDLSASKFADTGFTKAAITLTVSSNDGKKTEIVDISPASAGANYIAQRRGEEGLYEIDADAIKQLRQTAADVKEVQTKKK